MKSHFSDLQQRAHALHLNGLLSRWAQLDETQLKWVGDLIEWEEQERERRARSCSSHSIRSPTHFNWVSSSWAQRDKRPFRCSACARCCRSLKWLFMIHLLAKA